MKLRISRKLKTALLCAMTMIACLQGVNAEAINYAGGTTNWGTDTAAFDTSDLYTDEMEIAISGDSTLSLTTSVAPSALDINAGKTTIGSAAGAAHTLGGNISIAESAHLDVNGALLSTSGKITGTGTFEYTSDATNQISISSVLSDFAGDLILNDSNVRFDANPANIKSITLNAESFLRLNANVQLSAATAITMNGSESDHATISFSDNSSVGAVINATGHVAFNPTYGTGTLSAGIAGTGTVWKTGGTTLRILGDSTHTGTFEVYEGSTIIGNGDSTLESVDFSIININENATLHLNKASVDATTRITGTGSLELSVVAEADYGSSYFLQDFSGDVYLRTSVLFNRDNAISADATLHVSGGQRLRLDGADTAADIVLNGSTTEGGARASLSTGSGVTVTGMVTATGEAQIDASWLNATLSGGLSGSGNLYKSDYDYTVSLHKDSTHTGNLILEGGTFQIGNGISNADVSVAFNEINIESGSQLTISTNSDIGLDATTINMQGGTLHNHDTTQAVDNGVTDYNKAVNIGKINVEADSTFSNEWKGLYVVNELTGNAKLSFSGSSKEQLIFSAETINDYNGTIDLGSNSNRDIELGVIDQAEGQHVLIKGAADGVRAKSGLTKSGAGTATIESALNVSGGNLEVQGGVLNLAAATQVDGGEILGGGQINLMSEAASLSITGADYAITGTAEGGSITGDYSLTANEINNAYLTGLNLNVTSAITLSNVTLDSSVTISDKTLLSISDSKLTGLTVVDNGAIDFKTSEGFDVSSIDSYSITGVKEMIGDTAATGSLTLDLGSITLDDMAITAFLLTEYEGISELIASGWYGDINLVINGGNYQAQGAVIYTDPVTSDSSLMLYIPEPSTATLSLLALAGLLARRRRHAA